MATEMFRSKSRGEIVPAFFQKGLHLFGAFLAVDGEQPLHKIVQSAQGMLDRLKSFEGEV